MNVDTSYH